MRVRKFWNKETHAKTYCNGGGEYLVKPEESLTIKQIISRYMQGMPLDIMRRPCTFEDDDVDVDTLLNSPDIDTSRDLVDIMELQDNVTERIVSIASKLKKRAKKVEQKQKEEIEQ